MSYDDDDSPVRKGKLSAFQLLKSWLFDKKSDAPAHNETEFLNTRDGYELARFAQKAFGGDAEAKKAHEAAVEAEQAEIDALLQGTGAVPIPTAMAASAPAAAAPRPPVAPAAPVAQVSAPPAVSPPPMAATIPPANYRPMPPIPGAHGRHHPAPPAATAAEAPAPEIARAPARAAAAPASGKPLTPLEIAVNHLEVLRSQGMTVEVLAEALIVIESRDVKRRSARSE